MFEVWGGEVNKMNKKNEKTWRVGWVLVLAVVLAVGAGGLLRANDEAAGGQSDKGAEEETKKSQEEVLKELLEESSPGPMIITHDIPDQVSVPVVEAVDPKAKLPLAVREGAWLINRQGRLGKDAKGTLLFVYEADGKDLSEPPLILLPCQKLEQMEQLASKNPNAKFMVSGEVMVYRGRGYLLMRKVMPYNDMGQF